VKPILLDTCALIWLANRDTLAAAARASLEEVGSSDGQIVVSPISAWEIGQLAARGRLERDPSLLNRGIPDLGGS